MILMDNSAARRLASARMTSSQPSKAGVEAGPTTAAVERLLGALNGDAPIEPQIHALLERAVGRLRMLCANLLHKSYPRLARAPLGLEADELLGAVVARLLKALRSVRPATVRQFFGLANQHMRWELNDLARQLDGRPAIVTMVDGMACAPEPSDSVASPNLRRMLESIDELPEPEREMFDLVRIQGLTHVEAAAIAGVATKTVQRRLNRGLLLLAQKLDALRPPD
jgi:RNA polymerase sigma factor (sigma-70 family)